MTRFPRLAAFAAAFALLSGPAAAAEKRFGLASFETIEVNGDFIVEVTTRAPVSAVASGSLDALDRLSVEADNGKLVIGERRFGGNGRNDRPRGPVTIRVNAANLKSAAMAGAGTLSIDKLGGDRVSVLLRGPGQLTVGKIAADRLALTMIGNGTLTVAGAVKTGQLSLSGAGVLDAGALAVDDLTSESEGAGDLTVRAVKRAAVTARGVGKTVVLGRPACTVRNMGGGSVSCGTVR